MATDQTLLKRRAAERALDLVESGMLLGLGTGSTAEQFVNALASKIRAGELSDIECVATSTKIESYAEERGLRCRSLGKTRELDLAVDGADEVDGQLRLVKGRGGALLREKIVAQASKIFAVIVDESKLVERLGAGPLPVEVTAFAADRLLVLFDGMGLDPSPRLADVGWLITDEGNRIIDVTVPTDRDIAEVVGEMKQWAGVIETGFFSHEASCVVIAGESGVRSIERKGGG